MATMDAAVVRPPSGPAPAASSPGPPPGDRSPSPSTSSNSFRDLRNRWEERSVDSARRGRDAALVRFRHDDGAFRSSHALDALKIPASSPPAAASRGLYGSFEGDESPYDTTASSTASCEPAGRGGGRGDGSKKGTSGGRALQRREPEHAPIGTGGGDGRKGGRSASAVGGDGCPASRLQADVRALLLSSPSAVRALRLLRGPCPICRMDDHPALRCRALTDAAVEGGTRERLEDVRRWMTARRKTKFAADCDDRGRGGPQSQERRRQLRNRQLRQRIDGYKQKQHQRRKAGQPQEASAKEASPASAGPGAPAEAAATGAGTPAELGAFLSSPTGMNWEDLVRSLKAEREAERGSTLLNREIAFRDDEDDVSELGCEEGRRREGGFDDLESDGSSTGSSASSEPSRRGPRDDYDEEMADAAVDDLLGRTVDGGSEASPNRAHHRVKSRPQDALTRRIERIVTEQQSPGGTTRDRTPRIPPPRSVGKSASPRRPPGPHTLGGRPGSAFSPVRRPPSTGGTAPASSAPSPALGASATSTTASRSSPLATFRTIERHPRSPPQATSRVAAPVPVSPEGSPRRDRGRAGPRDVDVPPRVAAAGRRGGRRRRDGSPSDPPILMCPSADEASAADDDNHGGNELRSPDDVAAGPLGRLRLQPPASEGSDGVDGGETGEGDGMKAEEEKEEDDSFYQRIRGASPPRDFSQIGDVSGQGSRQGSVECAESDPFPTTLWEGVERARVNASQDADDGGSPLGKASPAARNGTSTIADSRDKPAGPIGASADMDKDASLLILPESLSVNRRQPTCWQVARHRIRKTKCEF